MAIRKFSTSSISTGAKSSKLWDQFTEIGSYQSIASVTVTSGGTSGVTFNNIPAGFTHLQLRVFNRGTNASNYVETRLQFNGDTAANYASHQFYGIGNSGSPTTDSEPSSTNMYILYTTGANALSSTFGTCVVDIFDFANTNKYKTIKTIAGHDVNGGTGYALIRSGHWRSNNAITSLYIYPSAGNFAEHSHFALYGIKVVS